MRLRPAVARAVARAADAIFPPAATLGPEASQEGPGGDTERDGHDRGGGGGKRAWNGGAAAVLTWLVRLPARLLYALRLLGRVSASVALLNALPIWGLDGHLAAVQFIRLWLLAQPPPQPPPHLEAQAAAGHSAERAERAAHHHPTAPNKPPIAGQAGGGSSSALSTAPSPPNSKSNRPVSPRSLEAGTSSGRSAQVMGRSHARRLVAASVRFSGGAGSALDSAGGSDPGAGGGEEDREDERVAQLLREQWHDWNALHARQKRLTRLVLGGGSLLVAVNVLLGGVAVLGRG
mmetsp:Transcript_18829/g.42782  ORF Transcript_18829/g.42782 Transcript_18829/m.42782 type:complete len:291 (+) Transcript_18829:1877-2749(+)